MLSSHLDGPKDTRKETRQANFEMKRQDDGTFYVHMYLSKLSVAEAAALAKVFQTYNERENA